MRAGAWPPAARYPVWFTKFPIQLQRGKAVEYRYFILSGGEFKRFENFTGSRVLLPRGRFRLISDKLDSVRPLPPSPPPSPPPQHRGSA